ncbi:MAG: hypothetical protein LBE13_11675 [Bacteroidales bacterium]|jgi:hypothetical protein|nr:hypothetical protein [Bacteroidales bacterium]
MLLSFKMPLTKKLIIATLLALVVLCVGFLIQTAHAAMPTLNSWDCVDSGKHLDWDGRTNYMPQFERAVNTLNNYKSGVIRKDTIWIVEDVKISDYYEVTNITASASLNGKIKFNQYNMDRYTDAQNQNICTAMLGYCLGLGRTSNPTDVMYASVNSVTSLSENDKASYNEAYKKY